MEEVFRKIEGYEDYEVSNLGKIVSLKNGKRRTMIQMPDSNGYLRIDLFKNGKRIPKRVHRLVLEAFVPNPEGKPEGNHKDGIKKNNFVWNLEWCTSSENLKHAFKNGLLNPSHGERHYSAKLTEVEVKNIREDYTKGKTTHRKLAKEYGVSHTVIYHIVKRFTWKHI